MHFPSPATSVLKLTPFPLTEWTDKLPQSVSNHLGQPVSAVQYHITFRKTGGFSMLYML